MDGNRHLAKVGVAGSNPVFRSGSVVRGSVELVGSGPTLLRRFASCGPRSKRTISSHLLELFPLFLNIAGWHVE